MGQEVKIVLDQADRRCMLIEEPRLDTRVDSIKSGQVNLSLSRKTARPVEEVPKIMQVHTEGIIH
jgi:hypothetical protein